MAFSLVNNGTQKQALKCILQGQLCKICETKRWSRGVYTSQALQQMLHGKPWEGKYFSQSWGRLNAMRYFRGGGQTTLHWNHFFYQRSNLHT